jgi:CelD/BcsL family acetyltransferase involved in cellulose biosynthesis
MGEKKYTVKVLDSLSGSFIKEWRELWDRAENCNIFNSYDWFLTCEKTYRFRDFAVYACYNGNQLVGVLAVVFRRFYGVRVAMAPGSVYVVEPPVLLEKYDEDIVRAILFKLGEEHNYFITKINKEELGLVKKSIPGVFCVLASVNPYLEIGDDPFRFVSKGNMGNLRRRIKKSGDNLRFRMYYSSDNLDKYLEEMIMIEQQSTKKRRQMDLFSSQENREIYKNMIAGFGEKVSICFLYYENQPIAYSFNFTYKKRFIFFQIAYLFAFRKFSPGKQLVVHLLKFLKEQKIEVFDFSGGISSYKQEFAPEFYMQYNVMYSQNSLVMGWWKLINFARRMKQVLLPTRYTKDHEYLFRRV